MTVPVAEEAEEALIGGLLSWDYRAPDPDPLPPILDIIQPDDLWHEGYRSALKVMSRLWLERAERNVITVAYALSKEGDALDKCGGNSGLHDLVRYSAGYIGLEYWAGIILEASRKRKLMALGSRLASEAAAGGDDADTLLDRYSSAILTAGTNRLSAQVTRTMSTLFDQHIPDLEEWMRDPRKLAGPSTGIRLLDRRLRGLAPQRVTMLAADTGIGKSLLASQIAQKLAADGIPVLFFSTEMGAGEVWRRCIFRAAGIDPYAVERRGYAEAHEEDAIRSAAGWSSAWTMRINDMSGAPISSVIAEARRVLAVEHHPVLVVDHIDMLTAPGEKRSEQVPVITSALKSLARDAGVHVLAVSHINRASVLREKGAPLDMSSLKDSSSKGQDSDAVLFLEPVKESERGALVTISKYEADNLLATEGRCLFRLNVAKNRHGTTGSVILQLSWDNGGWFTLPGEES